MKALEERILKDGQILPGEVLKVGSFLNHQIDPAFMMDMGREIARLFENDRITKVLTIETSGIPIAMAAAYYLGVPMVFAKKHSTINISGDMVSTVIHSYTHNTDYNVLVEKRYLSCEDRVLVVDDFLASGRALVGLFELVKLAGATVAGAAVAIEKVFQQGGNELRRAGYKVEALASIESFGDGTVTFCR